MTLGGSQTAFITGAANGIGKACALELAALGWNLVISDVVQDALKETANEVAALGVSVDQIVIDLSSEHSVESGMEQALTFTNQLDAAVFAAGVPGPGYRSGAGSAMVFASPLERFLNSTLSEWDEVMNINLRATAQMARAVAKAMIPNSNGSIVAVSSVAGSNPMLSSTVSYSVSKAGVNALVKHLAGLLGPHGIRVNAVAPGVIETNMSSGFLSQEGVKSKVESDLPLRSIGKATDIANAVKFLVTGESRYITGETIFVDGGQFTG